MLMTTWRSIFALAAAGAFIAGPAFAQGGGTTSPSGGAPTKPGGADQDAAKPSDQTSPSASPSTAPGEKSQADKPGAAGGQAAGGGGQQQVKAAQQALKDKGQDPGPIDGVMGPKTQAALKAFQQAEGLTTTGRLDSETMAKLGVGEGGGSSPSASPGGQQQGTEQKKGQQQ
jgi:peptidoglycan hydrolase-like protein with peptidoglycan-binding domain